MNSRSKEICIGLFLAIGVTLVGTFVCFVWLSQDTNYKDLITHMGLSNFNKMLTLGALPNLPLFFLLLSNGRILKARGVLLGCIIVTLFTISSFLV